MNSWVIEPPQPCSSKTTDLLEKSCQSLENQSDDFLDFEFWKKKTQIGCSKKTPILDLYLSALFLGHPLLPKNNIGREAVALH